METCRGAGRYISWSRLLRRVFNLDMECCPNCGGKVKVVAAIEEPGVIKKILTYLGLSPHPPPKSPARYDPYSESDISALASCVALPPTSMWSYLTY